MNRAKALWGLVIEVAVAYVGYRIALLFGHQADLRGGFLLLSPFFALGVVAMLGPWDFFARRQRTEQRAPYELQQRVKAMSEKFGVPVPEIFVDKSSETFLSEVRFIDEHLCFHLSKWMKLPTSHQDFVLASEIAGHLYDAKVRGHGWTWTIGKYTMWLLASALACINLWWIIPLQSVGALSAIWFVQWYGMRRTLALDIQAVRATGDLAGAISFIRKQARGFDFASASADRRIANLSAAFS